MDTQKVKVLKDCAIGGQHTPAGKLVVLSVDDAKELIAMGRAEPAELAAAAEGDAPGKSKGNGK